MADSPAASDPHADQPVRTAGPPLTESSAAVVLLHGRGARAAGMLDIAKEFPTDDVAYRAIQAASGTWYPQSFLAPIESNEPALTSALGAVARELSTVGDAGIPRDRVVLLGFSQGACLATEYAARNTRRFGGVIAFSGGLIGPDGVDRDYNGSFDGTPAFFGCSDADPHIPVDRVHESTRVYTDLGAEVDERIYEGMGHTINQDELDAAGDIIGSLAD